MEFRAANVTDMNLIPVQRKDVVQQGDRCYLTSTQLWYTLGSDARTWLPDQTYEADSYPACHYVVKSPSTWNPAATSAADLDGCTTLAVGERVLCPSGASVGIYIASSATVCVADSSFVVREGYTVRCTRSAGAPPVYRQTAASGTAVFSALGPIAPTTTQLTATTASTGVRGIALDTLASYTRVNAVAWQRDGANLNYESRYETAAKIQHILGSSLLNVYFPEDATITGWPEQILTIPPLIGSDTLAERHTTDLFQKKWVNGRAFIWNNTNTNKSLTHSGAATTKSIFAVLIPAAQTQASFGTAVASKDDGTGDPMLLQTTTQYWYASALSNSVNGAENRYIYTSCDVYHISHVTGTAGGLSVGGVSPIARDFKGYIGAVVQTSTVPNRDQIIEVSRALRQYYQVARIIPVNLIGDSLTMSPVETVRWTQRMQLSPHLVCRNYGSSGWKIQDHLDNSTRLLTSTWSFDERKRIATVWAGTNDINLAGSTGEEVASKLFAFCDQLRAGGYRVVLSNIMARGDATWTPTMEGYRQTCNALIAANGLQHADALVDTTEDARLQNPADTTHFAADKIHLIEAGYTVIGSLFAPPIEALAVAP